MLAGTVLILSQACSSGAGDGDRQELNSPTDEQQEAYEACLAEAGYTEEDFLPRRGETSVTYDDAAYAVLSRCAAESGVGEMEGDTPEEADAETRKATTLVRCLRERGWDVDDPEPSPVGDYLIPPRLPVPRDREEANAFMADLTECGRDAGIEVMAEDEGP